MNIQKIIEGFKNYRKVQVVIKYDGKKLDAFDIDGLLPEDFEEDKITFELLNE